MKFTRRREPIQVEKPLPATAMFPLASEIRGGASNGQNGGTSGALGRSSVPDGPGEFIAAVTWLRDLPRPGISERDRAGSR